MAAGFWTRPIRETLAQSGHPVAQQVGDHYNAKAAERSARLKSKSRRGTSHTFHLLMTIFTGGLWAPVWIFMTVWHHVGPRKTTVTRIPGARPVDDQVTATVEFVKKPSE